MQSAQFGDGGCAADRRQAAFIAINKRACRLTARASPDIVGGPVALLNRNRRHARQHLACWSFEGREISDYEDLRVAGNAEVLLNQHTPSAIHCNAELR